MLKIQQVNQSKELISALEEYLNNPQGYFVLAGENGTGKSYACEAYLQDFEVKYGRGVRDHSFARMVSQAELNMLWKASMNDYGSDIYLCRSLIEPRLLILDDLGTRKPTEAFMDFIYLVVDQRYTNRKEKPTMITTNKNSKDLREIMGDAFVSRAVSGKIFRLEGKDRRQQGF